MQQSCISCYLLEALSQATTVLVLPLSPLLLGWIKYQKISGCVMTVRLNLAMHCQGCGARTSCAGVHHHCSTVCHRGLHQFQQLQFFSPLPPLKVQFSSSQSMASWVYFSWIMFVFWQIQQLWFDLVVSGYGTQCGVFY